MPHRRGHSDVVNIDANQMDASIIDATIYQKHNKMFFPEDNTVIIKFLREIPVLSLD